MQRLSLFFRKNTSGRLILLLIACYILIQVFLFVPQSGRMAGTGPIDLLFFYTPEKVYGMIDAYGPELRAQYRTFELTADLLLYPVVYTLLLAFTISWLFQRGFARDSRMQSLNVVPVGAWFFDLLENLAIVGMLSIHPDRPAALAWAATVFTMVKWGFAVASLLLLLVGVGAALRRRGK